MSFLTFTLLILSPIPSVRGGVSERLCGAELPPGVKPRHGVRAQELAAPHATQGSRGSWQLDAEQGVPSLPAPHSHTSATALVLGQRDVHCPSQNATAGGLGQVNVAEECLSPEGLLLWKASYPSGDLARVFSYFTFYYYSYEGAHHCGI